MNETEARRALERVLAAGHQAGVRDRASRAARQAADTAFSQGLVDAAYDVVDSPVGDLLLAATQRGLVMVAFERGELGRLLAQLAASLGPRILHLPDRLAEPRRQLTEYFAGERQAFDVDVDWSLTRGFNRRVLEATARIPFGEVRTYQQVAAVAGSPRGARAAGQALGSNPVAIVVPCHRVLRTGGHLGGYAGGLDRKEQLLRLEGALA